MRITRLEIRDVRILEESRLEPAARLNFFCGPNGSGKTALLEAIYILSRGRSFRTHRMSEALRHGRNSLQVCGYIQHGMDGEVVAGVEWGKGALQMRYQGERVRRVSEHAARLPVILLTPDSQLLVFGEPRERRHWLDWAMFHVEPSYLETWRCYFRALRHRNALLKDGMRGTELSPWEESMGQYAGALENARRAFISELNRTFSHLAAAVWSEAPQINLSSGWDMAEPLQDRLKRDRGSDCEAGFTRAGPHRSDISFYTGEHALGAVFSRGECKLFLSILMLSQAEVVAVRTGENPLLLADDFGAELDPTGREKLHSLAMTWPWQTFMTGTDCHWDPVPPDSAVFHVEHGQVRKMVE